MLERMKRLLTSFAAWVALLLLTVVSTDIIRAFLGPQFISEAGAPNVLSSAEYATRFLLEATVFSIVGIVSARRVRSAPQSGLFALGLGVAYVLYVEWNSGLWYYMVAHSTRTDQFFFTAPILAPVLFTTGACLVWRAFARGSSGNAF